MKKLMFLILFICFSFAKTSCAQSATAANSTVDRQDVESLVASPDLGVADISQLTKIGTKHFFKVKIKNFSFTQAALNVQVKYRIGPSGWITLPPVLSGINPLATLTTGNIPTTGISGLVSGQTYTLQVCTIDATNTANNCRTKTVIAP